MKVKMKMPDLGTTEDEVTVLRWLVEAGQPVRRGQPLLEVETDKATLDVESIATGVLDEQCVNADDAVPAGQLIAVIEADEKSALPAAAPPRREAPAPASPTPVEPEKAASRPSAAQSMFARNRQAAEPVAEQVARYDKDLILGMYSRMCLIREFEERVKFLFLEGSMPGTIHQCQGQEASAVGVCTALNEDDYITSTHRPHGHALAKGLSPEEMMCELFGCETGCCRGRGGSMHMGNMDKGMVPAIAIVGGGIPVAAGMALGLKMQGQSQVVACFFGDGATSEGAFHEGVNLAAIWDLPVIFVCENNLYGASTHLDKVTRVTSIADRAPSYGIRGEAVDGMNVLAVYQAVQRAAAECRAGKGPVLLELLTYRLTGHSRRDGCHYQPDTEKQAWAQRDPIELMKEALLERDDFDAADLEAIRSDVEQQLTDAIETASQDPHPTVQDLTTDVFTR